MSTEEAKIIKHICALRKALEVFDEFDDHFMLESTNEMIESLEKRLFEIEKERLNEKPST